MASWPEEWPYPPGRRGKCPWCGVGVQFVIAESRRSRSPAEFTTEDGAQADRPLLIDAYTATCPACHRVVISLLLSVPHSTQAEGYLLYPPSPARAPVPKDVPPHIAEDYWEAALVLPYSPKASAALSRRCLQAVLREAGKTTKRELAEQIEEVLGGLPPHLAGNVDAIRNIGNFAAHPQKSQQTGEILPVEPHEAEWTLDVLDQLFDFYYVQPALARAKRVALDAKLAEAGKPPMKQPVP